MIRVREYALLTCDRTQTPGMDLGIVSESTFSWLDQLHQKWGSGSQMLSRDGKCFLRLGSYVGYLQSPNGESIEILPKTSLEIPTEVASLRQLLQRMLSVSLGMTPREADQATLQKSSRPLHEWIIREFLLHLAHLLKNGLRHDYQFVEDDHSAFIRGQLNMTAQMRQLPGRDTRFHVRYAEFSPQRIENRLLRTALNSVLKVTKEERNWQQANMLSHLLDGVQPIFGNPKQLMEQWGDGRFLFGYRAVKPWCQLILEATNPDFQNGLHQGISLLFPMEKLYESWVGHCLSINLHRDYRLTKQSTRRYLLEHLPVGEQKLQQWFMLKPDFLITGNEVVLLDAKWKLLDGSANDSRRKYGLSQADQYQMFAYGQKYLNGKGNMMLIYPLHRHFDTPLPEFRFGNDLYLWCVPFDLESGELVNGEWKNFFHCFSGNETGIGIGIRSH